MDNLNLGRKGDMFVIKKMLENGWEFIGSSEGDLIFLFRKDDRTIRILVKTYKEKIRFSFNEEINFDYLVINDLKDCWIIPKEMVNNVEELKTLGKLQGKFNLLEFSKKRLLSEINDCGVRFHEINQSKPFFN